MAESRPLTENELRSRPFLTAREVAATLNCSKNSVYNYAARGLVPSVKVGDRLVFPSAWLLSLIATATASDAPLRIVVADERGIPLAQ